MTNEEMIKRLSAFITCLKCETSGKECDLNCATQYEAGNMGEIIDALDLAIEAIRKQDPKKPNETTDRAWGIECKQAVCPNCDCYLGMVHFICDGDKKKITYCESCGQAIDWKEWEDDE